MNLRNWNDIIKEKTPLKLIYFYTDWCEECDKQLNELNKIDENSWNTFFSFSKVNADERPDLALRYSPQIYPSISIISESNVIGGTFGLVENEKILEIMLLSLDLYKGGGKLVKPIAENKKEKNEEKRKLSNKEILEIVKRNCLSFFDIYYGGFEKEPKYYLPNVLEFLLDIKDNYTVEAVKYTLDAVIYNLWDYGFYAYAKKYDWKEPSKVKLLDLNADMIKVLLKAYEVTKDEYYLNYAIETANWLYKARTKKEEKEYYPIGIIDEKPVEPYLLSVNSEIGEAFLKIFEITNDKKYLDESNRLSEELRNNIKHNLLDDNSPLFLIDLAHLIRFLSNMNQGKEILKIVYDKFYGDDAFYDVPLHFAIQNKIGRFKLITDNSILAQGLIKLGLIEEAKRIIDYFSSTFYNFAYFNQADYANLIVMLNEGI